MPAKETCRFRALATHRVSRVYASQYVVTTPEGFGDQADTRGCLADIEHGVFSGHVLIGESGHQECPAACQGCQQSLDNRIGASLHMRYWWPDRGWVQFIAVLFLTDCQSQYRTGH